MLTCQQPVKSFFYFSVMVIALFRFGSCGDDRQLDTKEVVIEKIKPADLTKENDKQFLVRAVEMKYEQILLGKLAQRRSTTEEVIELAKMLEEANRETKSSLASLGIIKSIPVPSVPPQAAHDAYNELNEASVEDFDLTYVRFSIQGYNDAISLFENATRGNLDPDIKSRALAMLPDMRQQLSKAMEVDAHMNPVSELFR